MTTNNFCIVITEPFRRPLAYEFDSRQEAENIAFVIRVAALEGELAKIGIEPGTAIETMVVPAQELTKHYDA